MNPHVVNQIPRFQELLNNRTYNQRLTTKRACKILKLPYYVGGEVLLHLYRLKLVQRTPLIPYAYWCVGEQPSYTKDIPYWCKLLSDSIPITECVPSKTDHACATCDVVKVRDAWVEYMQKNVDKCINVTRKHHHNTLHKAWEEVHG